MQTTFSRFIKLDELKQLSDRVPVCVLLEGLAPDYIHVYIVQSGYCLYDWQRNGSGLSVC